MVLNINGKSAVRIKGKFMGKSGTGLAMLVDCDGELHWFPIQCVRDDGNDEVSIQEWIYKQKFPKG